MRTFYPVPIHSIYLLRFTFAEAIGFNALFSFYYYRNRITRLLFFRNIHKNLSALNDASESLHSV